MNTDKRIDGTRTYHTSAVGKPRLVSDIHWRGLVHETGVDDRHLDILGQVTEQGSRYLEET